MTPALIQPREIDLYDPHNTGRIGEVVGLRANENAGVGHRGRLVRVALDPEALDVSSDEAGRERIDGLLRMFDAERITFLPPATLATVEEFGITPAGRSCARLKAGLLVASGLSAWCLMRADGVPLPPANPPIANHLMGHEPDLRALRARHPQYFAQASETEVRLLDLLFLSRGSVEVLVIALRDNFMPWERAEIERNTHLQEQAFVSLRQRVEEAPAFLSLTPADQSALRRELFHIDFDNDPFK